MNCENESSTHRRVRRGDTNVQLQLNADRNVISKNEWKNKDINPMPRKKKITATTDNSEWKAA